MSVTFEKNCQIIEEYAKKNMQKFHSTQLRKYYENNNYIHNPKDCEVALNFLESTPLLKKTYGKYEISNYLWSFNEYLKEQKLNKLSRDLSTEKTEKDLKWYSFREGGKFILILKGLFIFLNNLFKISDS